MTDQVPTNLRGAVDLTPLARKAVNDGVKDQPSAVATVDSLVFKVTDASIANLVELTATVPLVIEFFAGSPSTTLEKIITGYSGKLLLGQADASANPGLSQAFQVSAVPTVVAVIAGRPLPLYQGELPEDQAGSVFDQVIAVAIQNGVQGVAQVAVKGEEPATQAPEPLPPHHQEAFDAIEKRDFDTAIAEYKKAIAQDPRDHLAVVGLAQVSLLKRLDGADAQAIRSAAAQNPTDLEDQLAVCDLDVAGGHLSDAFDRLLELFPNLNSKQKDKVRLRLIDYFELAGAEDPRVAAARRKLSALLY